MCLVCGICTTHSLRFQVVFKFLRCFVHNLPANLQRHLLSLPGILKLTWNFLESSCALQSTLRRLVQERTDPKPRYRVYALVFVKARAAVYHDWRARYTFTRVSPLHRLQYTICGELFDKIGVDLRNWPSEKHPNFFFFFETFLFLTLNIFTLGLHKTQTQNYVKDYHRDCLSHSLW